MQLISKKNLRKCLIIVSFCIEIIQEILNSAQNLIAILVALPFEIEVLTGARVMP